MKYQILIASVLVIFSACKPTSNTDSENLSSQSSNRVSLEKIDSIQIDYLGNPTVHDIDPSSKVVIFMEHREFSEDIFVAGFDGKIKASFSKFGDMPDTYGRLLSSLRISDEKSILAYGVRGFFTYSFDGTFLKSVENQSGSVMGQRIMGMGNGPEKLNDFYVANNQGTQQRLPNGSLDYSKISPLALLNFKTGESEPILAIPSSSMFRKNLFFFHSASYPQLSITDQYIICAFGIEPKLYLFSKEPPFSLVRELDLALPNYEYFKGAEEYSPNNLGILFQERVSGKILNIKKIDDYFLIGYFPGFDQNDAVDAFKNRSNEEAIEFWNQMAKKYPNRLAVADSSGKVLLDTVPGRLYPSSMMLRDGQIWMSELPDEEIEQDYFRLFRVELKVGK